MARTCPMCSRKPCTCGFLSYAQRVSSALAVSTVPDPRTPTIPPPREPERKLRGEVIGFRSWGAQLLGEQAGPDTVVLMSTGIGATAWHAGPNKARCVSGGDDHDSPHEACECGLYGWHDPRRALRGSLNSTGDDGTLPGVPGAIKAWGRLEVHATGFRAEYAQIVSLAIPEHIRILQPELAEELRHLARLFDARIVAMDDLELAAREFGDTVPEGARPKVRERTGEVTLTISANTSVKQFAAAMAKMQSRQAHAWTGFATGLATSLQSFESAQQKRRRRSRHLWSTIFAGIALVNLVFGAFGGDWLNIAAAVVGGLIAAWMRWS